MVFFTIVIIAKNLMQTIPCPLFDDAVAAGSMLYSEYKDVIADSTDLDALKNEYLSPANASHLLKDYIYMSAEKTGVAGVIADNCTYAGHMPGPYCDLQPQECAPKYFTLTSEAVYSMPTMTFSFVCHTAVLPIYAELKGRSASQMKKVAGPCSELKNTMISVFLV
jgi:hypothetical protein